MAMWFYTLLETFIWCRRKHTAWENAYGIGGVYVLCHTLHGVWNVYGVGEGIVYWATSTWMSTTWDRIYGVALYIYIYIYKMIECTWCVRRYFGTLDLLSWEKFYFQMRKFKQYYRIFCSADGGSRLKWAIYTYLQNYTASHPKRL